MDPVFAPYVLVAASAILVAGLGAIILLLNRLIGPRRLTREKATRLIAKAAQRRRRASLLPHHAAFRTTDTRAGAPQSTAVVVGRGSIFLERAATLGAA